MGAPVLYSSERAAVGAALCYSSLAEQLTAELSPPDFVNPTARAAFAGILSVWEDMLEVNPISVQDRSGLKPDEIDELMKAGKSVGQQQLATLVSDIRRVSDLRKVYSACRGAAQMVGSDSKLEDVLEGLERQLYKLDRTGSTEALDGSDVMERVVDGFLERHASGGGPEVSTGLRDLDKAIIGLRPGKNVIIAARPGVGKALAVDELVMTPSGPVRMGDLEVGDLVTGSDGNPTRVIGSYPQGVLRVYRVTFDDGVSVLCCAEHQWFTRTKHERSSGKPGSVRNTLDVRRTLSTGDGHRNHSIQYPGPFAFERSGQLPVDPYTLGAWLGDGSWSSCVRFHNSEPDVVGMFVSGLPKGDAHSTRDGFPGKRGDTVTVTGGGMRGALRKLGLSGTDSFTKFIPEQYMMATVGERVRLLRGLMDTDGYVADSGKGVEFSTSSDRLALCVMRLVRSLGGTCSMRKRATHYVTGGKRVSASDSYRVFLSFPAGNIVPVSSGKHLARFIAGPSRVSERFIVSIEPAGLAECKCITVDAKDSLYVTADGIVTHNTSLSSGLRRSVVSQGLGAIEFNLEMSADEICERELAFRARVNLRKILAAKELTDEEIGRIRSVRETVRGELGSRWYIDDRTYSISGIRRRARIISGRMARAGIRLGVVILDYIQLAGDNGDGREQAVSAISRGCKLMAKELGCTVLALSQLNRACESRDDRRPMLSDLRESGSLEQDCDICLMLYRDSLYDPSSPEDDAEILVRKHRSGPTGTVRCRYNGKVVAFEDRNENTALTGNVQDS